jgi:hypothetical protein
VVPRGMHMSKAKGAQAGSKIGLGGPNEEARRGGAGSNVHANAREWSSRHRRLDTDVRALIRPI